MSIHTTPNYGLSYYDQYDIGWHSGINNNFINLDSILAAKQAALGFTPENAANKGAANGYAPLDGSSLVPLANIPSSIFPVQAIMWHTDSVITSGNAFYVALTSNQVPWQFLAYQSPGQNGDTFTQTFVLAAGTYTLSLLGFTNASSGQITVYIDNVAQSALTNVEFYSASNTWNVVKSGSVAITSSGVHTLKVVVTGKNASSSDYDIQLTRYVIR